MSVGEEEQKLSENLSLRRDDSFQSSCSALSDGSFDKIEDTPNGIGLRVGICTGEVASRVVGTLNTHTHEQTDRNRPTNSHAGT